MSPEQRAALERFVVDVGEHYGRRLFDIMLYGSRARGDQHAESDADLAIILDDGDWRVSAEVVVLADLAYGALMDTGLFIQAIPISRSDWETPGKHANRHFIETVRREGRRLREAA